MGHEIKVNLKDNSYKIVVGDKIISQAGQYARLLQLGEDAVIVTNRYIHKTHGRSLVSGLKKTSFTVKVFEVADSEKSKSAAVAFDLLSKIASYDVNKKIFVVAFGGGVIGDLAGFVAAVYKRGVPYIQVPTTFLAQIDSAIGGKTAIDLAVGKNLVGAFYQPKLVLSDMGVLATLSLRQIRNGLAEAIKYGVIADKNLFAYIFRNYKKLLALDPKALWDVVLRSSQIKARVVSLDEKETKKLRMILNFGHTVGHAIETAGGYKLYHHGEAIALGMRVAADIAHQMGLFSQNNCLLLETLLSNIGLPERIKGVSLARILQVMVHDKKFKAGKNRFVLPVQIGKVKIVEGVAADVIQAAIRRRL